MWIYHRTLGDADVFESVKLAVIEVHIACHCFVFHLRMFFEVPAVRFISKTMTINTKAVPYAIGSCASEFMTDK